MGIGDRDRYRDLLWSHDRLKDEHRIIYTTYHVLVGRVVGRRCLLLRGEMRTLCCSQQSQAVSLRVDLSLFIMARIIS